VGIDIDIVIERIKKDDERAFRQLYDLLKNRIYHFALKFTKSHHSAEEIVQEVFIKIWENRKNIKKGFSIRAYVFTTTYHTIINFLKKAAKDEHLKQEILLFADDYILTTDYGYKPEYERELHNAIEQLPPKRKEIFKMAKFEGKSYSEIASSFNIAKDTVRLQIIEANKFLKEYFKKRFMQTNLLILKAVLSHIIF
jgi:RNA polymerase sigma-70 factor (family 1)